MLDNIKSVPHAAGCKQVLRAVEAGEAECVLLAQDADDFIKNKVASACGARGVEIRYVPAMDELGRSCGIAVGCAACALLKPNF